MSGNVAKVSVLSITTWTPTLFSFTVSRPDSFRFSAGQFVRLGVNPSLLAYHQAKSPSNDKSDNNEEIFRAYSIVSSPFDEVLEFFSVVIEDGAFTSELQHLQVGDTLLLNTTAFGFLTLARYQEPAPKDLWLLATGTGLAPFLSILQDLQPWQEYEHIVLAYSVRTEQELAYIERINRLEEDFGGLVDNPAKFSFIPILTRKVTRKEMGELSTNKALTGALTKRLPELLTTGMLEDAAGIRLNPDSTHIMLCGNPQMVEDTKETLKAMGLTMNRRGVGNIAVENYW